VKVNRQGQVLWQFGGDNPVGHHFPGSWEINHGHMLLENGNFLFFNNGNGGPTSVFEYSLNESTWTATKVWSYASSAGSPILGDVQRLPNGNTLITYSSRGQIHEVDKNGELVQSFTSSTESLGYANHRPTLYGDPPR
jgi:hypothetical protein